MKNLKLLSIAALVIALGCQGNEAKPENNAVASQVEKKDAPAQPEAKKVEKPEEPAPVEKPVAGGPPVVTLLEAGDEPRRPLRLKIAKGAKAASVMTMKMGMEMKLGPKALPAQNIPATKMALQVEITEVSPAGDITYAFKIDEAQVVEEPGVPAALIEKISSVLSTMNGLSGQGVVSERGFNKGAKIDLPPGLTPQLQQTLQGMKQSLSQLAAPLPEEPVGVGARWKVEQLVTQNGLTLKQATIFELKEIDGDTLSLGVSVEQSADPQKFIPPGMPPGAEARLASLSSKGSGEILIDISHQVLPSTSTLSLRSDMKMQVLMGPETQDIDMKMTMDISILPK